MLEQVVAGSKKRLPRFFSINRLENVEFWLETLVTVMTKQDAVLYLNRFSEYSPLKSERINRRILYKGKVAGESNPLSVTAAISHAFTSRASTD